MQDSFDVHGSAGPAPTPLLDFERLDVYRVALEFRALASSIALPQGRRELRDQLDHAALSIVLNTAEGAGRTGAADKARFLAMARGSAMVPIISTFFGIVIRMFYQDHEPVHFHAEHQGQQAKFDLRGKMLVGNIRSKTARRLIEQWAAVHRGDLEANWARMKADCSARVRAGHDDAQFRFSGVRRRVPNSPFL